MQVSTFQTILSIFSSSIATVYKTEVSRQKSSAKQKDMKNHLSSVKLFEFSNGRTGTRCDISLEITIKTL